MRILIEASVLLGAPHTMKLVVCICPWALKLSHLAVIKQLSHWFMMNITFLLFLTL